MTQKESSQAASSRYKADLYLPETVVSNRMRIGILGGDDLLYDLGEIGVELINL
jgi:hypothetical protein